MTRATILDTGVLIAYLMPKDKFHAWAVSQLSQISTPVLTNEAVIGIDNLTKGNRSF